MIVLYYGLNEKACTVVRVLLFESVVIPKFIGKPAQNTYSKNVQITQKIDCKKVIEKGLTNGAGVWYTL